MVGWRPAAKAPPNFDGLAGIYRWMEWLSFGGWLARCRFAFLEPMRGARRALVLGDGDGRFTARLLQLNPVVRVDAVDLSPAMLEALKQRAGKNAGRVTALVADVRESLPEPAGGDEYDLVVTHFLLDCLTTAEVEELARRVRLRCAADARWVVSEFAVPTGWFGRVVAGPVVSLLYWTFGWMTGLRVRSLPEWKRAVGQAGFGCVRRKTLLGGLLVGETTRLGGV